MFNQYLLVFSLVFFAGCSTETIHDMYKFRPISKPPASVSSEIIVKKNMVLGVPIPDLKWNTTAGNVYYSKDIVQKCNQYLLTNNCPGMDIKTGLPKRDQISESEVIDNQKYPWLTKESCYVHRYTIEYAPGEKKAKYENIEEFKKHAKHEKFFDRFGYRTIKTISCLEPLVVIVSKGIIMDKGLPVIVSNDAGTTTLRLNCGYAHGTKIPYDETPYWFSPDMDIPPQKVEIDSNGIAHIPVPWGELVLSRDEDGDWEVTARKK